MNQSPPRFTLFAGALLATLALPAQAEKFNPDAMKAMQEKGIQVAGDAAGLAPLKALGLCLSGQNDKAKTGSPVSAGECKDKGFQRWTLDAEGRLANGTGLCLGLGGSPDQAGAKAQLVACDGAPTWERDDQGRIRSSGGKCLEAAGKGKNLEVKLSECGDAEGQRWK
jgi:hypothetical protein